MCSSKQSLSSTVIPNTATVICVPERKTMIRVSYYHGLVFGGIDQHTVASVPFVCNIELMHEPPVK